MKKLNPTRTNHPLLIGMGSLLFYTIAIPVLDSVSTYIQNQFNLRNVRLQAEAQQIQEEMQQPMSNINAVGFQIPTEETEDE